MKYDIIYADPPWQYQKKQNKSKKIFGLANRHYETMAPEEIYKLQVEKIAAKDSILFLWATFRKIEIALETIKHWGFKYKTIGFVWIKIAKSTNEPINGLGYWTAANAEICLIAVRGNARKHLSLSERISSVVMTHRGKHSAKPDEVRLRIEKLCKHETKKIELFARKKVKGWDSFGNEIKSDIIL